MTQKEAEVLQSSPPIVAPFKAASYGAGSIIIDKVGTIFQVWTGRLTNPGAWGGRVFRTVKGGKPELVWFIEDANVGALIILNKQLFLPFQPPKSGQRLQLIDGYIDLADTPSGQVVNVDESSLNVVKQSVATTQSMVVSADHKAAYAQIAAAKAQSTVDSMQVQLNTLRIQVNALQAAYQQGPGASQVTDTVWTKLWDVVYLLRMGMNAGTSTDAAVQGWINDLTNFIKKVK